jgi:hypothetical protein
MPLNSEQAFSKIKILIEKYYSLSNDARNSLSESNVVQQFLVPMLRALGWPVDDPHQFKYELSTQAGRPDITLIREPGESIFIEAKRFGAIETLEQARETVAGILTPGQLTLPGIASDRTAEEQQAINYAFKNNGKWAILTNFEKLRLFNARRDWLVLSFENPRAYEHEFDQLWQLSYEKICSGAFERLSNQRFRADVDTDYLTFINDWREKLAQDIVTHSQDNKWVLDKDGQIRLDRLRFVVQRILDRLVVVRFAEDHFVVPPRTLYGFYKLHKENPYTFTLNEFFGRMYRRFDEDHNSALFAESLADKAVFSDVVLQSLIEKLYEARYRAMSPDIMGNTYEQYLGQTLIETDGQVKTNGNLETRKKQGTYYTHQYIVHYIVDHTLGRYLYGTKNGKPGGEALPSVKRKKWQDIQGLRILDPACGSGSFLIYAYQVLADFYQSELKQLQTEIEHEMESLVDEGIHAPMDREIYLMHLRRQQRYLQAYPRIILQKHLYGVDLDPQAAEIATVNLVMRAMADQPRGSKRLPLILDQNIKVGNSLIGCPVGSEIYEEYVSDLKELRSLRLELANGDGEDHKRCIEDIQEVSKRLSAEFDHYLSERLDDAGSHRPFHWIVEFPEVFLDAEGRSRGVDAGFQIIIGNPPYGASLTTQERRYFYSKFDAGTSDTAALMMLETVRLLKQSGTVSMIVPKSFTYSSTWSDTRDRIIGGLEEIVDVGKAWSEVKLEQIIYRYEEGSDAKTYRSLQREEDEFVLQAEIDKDDYHRFEFYLNGVDNAEIETAKKMRDIGSFLGDYLTNTRGAGLQSEIKDEPPGRRAIGGKQVQPFQVLGAKGYICTLDEEIPANALVSTGDMLVQNIVAHITQPVDHIKIIAAVAREEAEDLVILDTVNCLSNTSDLAIEYFLGLLSSRAVNWYIYRFIFGRAIRTMHFDNPVSDRIPIPPVNLDSSKEKQQYDAIVRLVEEIESLHKQKSTCNDPSAVIQLEEAITARKPSLNEIVYALYALSGGEVGIIEEAMPPDY